MACVNFSYYFLQNYYSRHLNDCLSSYFIHTLLRRRHWILKEYRLRIIAGRRRERKSLWNFIAEEDYCGTSLQIIVGLHCKPSWDFVADHHGTSLQIIMGLRYRGDLGSPQKKTILNVCCRRGSLNLRNGIIVGLHRRRGLL